jgi:hypothetical protein
MNWVVLLVRLPLKLYQEYKLSLKIINEMIKANFLKEEPLMLLIIENILPKMECQMLKFN